MDKPAHAPTALHQALAYNLLFEHQRVFQPTLTLAEFNTWLNATVVGKVKAARAAFDAHAAATKEGK